MALKYVLAVCALFTSALLPATDLVSADKLSPTNGLTNLLQGSSILAPDASIGPDQNRALPASISHEIGAFTMRSSARSNTPVWAFFDSGILGTSMIHVVNNPFGGNEKAVVHTDSDPVFMGLPQCGAVSAVTEAVQGQARKLERRIPLVTPSESASQASDPGESVWQTIEKKSLSTSLLKPLSPGMSESSFERNPYQGQLSTPLFLGSKPIGDATPTLISIKL